MASPIDSARVETPLSPMRRHGLLPILWLLAWLHPAQAADRSFVTSDGVRLHYIEAGQGRTLVLVPGWTMPAWIFQVQIADLSRSWHVVALDPRSQGDSEIAPSGHEPYRRGRDIDELIAHLGDRQVLLLGWSLGVLDALSYVHQFGDGRLGGLVLVDNSVGEDPPPPPPRPTPHAGHGRFRVVPRDVTMRAFVRSMFVSAPTSLYLDRLTEAALRTPPDAAAALLAYPVPRTFWREAVLLHEQAGPVSRDAAAGRAGREFGGAPSGGRERGAARRGPRDVRR